MVKCCECNKKAIGYIERKPYCNNCYESQLWIQRSKRNEEKRNIQLNKMEVKQK